jgi:hypothetical protein
VAGQHEAGVGDPDCPPMGARFRLRADFDLGGFTPRARTILRAMQRYGLILADNGSDWYVQGTRDGQWRTTCPISSRRCPRRRSRPWT